MDPTACFHAIIAAIADGNANDAHEYAGNLETWMAQGGFPPQILNHVADAATLKTMNVALAQIVIAGVECGLDQILD